MKADYHKFIREVINTTKLQGKMAEAELIGKTVIVTSNYNGQPYGTSQKSRKGYVGKIAKAHIVMEQCILYLEGLEHLQCGIDIKNVEFI